MRAEITFLVLIALQYLGYIVANLQEKAKVITFKMICQHCNYNAITRDANRGTYVSYITQTITVN